MRRRSKPRAPRPTWPAGLTLAGVRLSDRPELPFILLAAGDRRRAFCRADGLVVSCWILGDRMSRDWLMVQLTANGRFPSLEQVAVIREALHQVLGASDSSADWAQGAYRLLPVDRPADCFTVVVPLAPVPAGLMGGW